MNTLKLLMFALVLLMLHCPAVDKFGLNPSHIKGSEAKVILTERLSSLFFKDLGDGNNDAGGGDLIASNLAGINEGSYYRRRDVEHCATSIYMASLAIHRAKTIYTAKAPVEARTIPPLLCKLKPVTGLIQLN